MSDRRPWPAQFRSWNWKSPELTRLERLAYEIRQRGEDNWEWQQLARIFTEVFTP